MEILKYDYNGKTFIAYLKNKKVYFGIKNPDSSIIDKLTEEEDCMIRSIYNFIVGDKKYLLKLSNVKLNDREFGVSYNTQNKLYSFNIINPQKNKVDIKTLAELNYLFNNQNEFLSIKKAEGETEVTPKQRIKDLFTIILGASFGAGVVHAIISVAIATTIALADLPVMPNGPIDFSISYKIEDMLPKNDTVVDNTNYSPEQVMKTFENNSYISKEEKDFLMPLLSAYLHMNEKYMSFADVNEKLSKLKIEYLPNDEKDEFEIGESTTGVYFVAGPKKGSIIMFSEEGANSFEECKKSTLAHEFGHVMEPNLNLSKTGINFSQTLLNVSYCSNNSILELINELNTREYMKFLETDDKTYGGYAGSMPIMYALCEIVDADTLLKCKYTGDDYYLTKYLSDLGISLNTIHDLYKSIKLATYIGGSPEIYDIIKECYEAKYPDEKMEDNLNIRLYVYGTPYSNPDFDRETLETVCEFVGIEPDETAEMLGIVPQQYILDPNKTEVYISGNNYDKSDAKILASKNAPVDVYALNDAYTNTRNKGLDR